jgi:hypothetical protein
VTETVGYFRCKKSQAFDNRRKAEAANLADSVIG